MLTMELNERLTQIGPAPPLPKYNLYTWDNTIRRIGYTIAPANGLQIMEIR